MRSHWLYGINTNCTYTGIHVYRPVPLRSEVRRESTKMAICTLCLIGVVIFGCSTGQVVYRSKGFKDNFMFEFDEICKEMDCNNAQYNYHRNSCQGRSIHFLLFFLTLFIEHINISIELRF